MRPAATRPLALGTLLAAFLLGASAAGDAARALGWVELLRAGRYEEAAAGVAPIARSALDAGRLASAWRELEQTLGPLGELSPGARRREQGLEVHDLRGRFQRGTFTVRVALDDEGRVAGFFVLPESPPPATDPGAEAPGAPPYADAAAFREVEVHVGAPELKHLFAAGEGRFTPDEYARPGHVDAGAIAALASWIATPVPDRSVEGPRTLR